MAGFVEVYSQCVKLLSSTCCYTDTNECVQGTDDCDDNAICINTVGSFVCNCRVGYQGDGRICEGIGYDCH